MARRVLFSKEIFLEKSKNFINEFGIGTLNTRDLCKYIGCSTQPLFRLFVNMDGYKKELKNYLHNYYDNFINNIVDKENYLFTISYAYALFAYKEPKIFQALFISELAGSRTINEVLASNWNIDTIKSIPKQYNVSLNKAKDIYRDVRFYTHGLSCQIACNSIIINEKEIKDLINNIIKNLI